MTYYYIYKITNKINGKIYYGQHTTDNLDDGYMGSGVAIKFAIKKYGLENFEKKILKFYNSPEELNIVEARLVSEKWLKKNKNRTYNLLTGGNKPIFSDEVLKKLSETHKGKPKSEEHKKKISESKKGHISWNKGVPMKEESKKKISESKKGHISWNKGVPMKEESKQKLSESHKGKHWFNNGIIEIQGKDCPGGFVKGRLTRKTI